VTDDRGPGAMQAALNKVVLVKEGASQESPRLSR